jgi:hypothetical protein
MSELAVRHLPGPEMRRGTVGTGTPRSENNTSSNSENIESALDLQAAKLRRVQVSGHHSARRPMPPST